VVKEDNTVTVRPVKTGPVQDDQTVITDGIAAGETVVIDGIDRLREGAKVEAVARGGADDPANKLTTENPERRHGKRGQGGEAGQGGQGGQGNLSPEERQKRWAEINKRIDAGEFGEEIKKLPEDQRRQKMMELRRQREAAAGAGNGSSTPANNAGNANGAK